MHVFYECICYISKLAVLNVAGCAEADSHGGLGAQLAGASQRGGKRAQLQPHLWQDHLHRGHLQVPRTGAGGELSHL